MTLPERFVSTTRIIVVGAGRWGLNHVATAHQLGVLAGVVDSSQLARSNASERVGHAAEVRYFESLAEALEELPGAAVVVATPPRTHFAVAAEAIESSRDVLVEKPLCDSVANAKKLVRMAAEAKVVLMVDHLLQYSFYHRRLLRLVRAGWVGEVTRVRASRFNFGTVRTEENVLWSLSPHDISILLAVCADCTPVRVSCTGQCTVSVGVEDYVDICLEFAGGARAQIAASWMHPLKERRLVVYGKEGVIILNEASPDRAAPVLQGFKWSAKRKADGSAVTISKTEEDLSDYLASMEAIGENGTEDGANCSPKAPLQMAVEHFLDCCKTRAVPRTDGREGLRVLRVLAAATESLEGKGAAIELNTPDITPAPQYFAHETALVDEGAIVGDGSKIWHFSHVMPGAELGAACNIGQNVYIGGKARLGKNVKVQNNVSIYDSVSVGDDVFLGPSCVLTNVKTPRSHINRKDAYSKTLIGRGATVGANATIVCGVELGEYCFVGAGAVVTKDVKQHALVYGNPARQSGWVSTSGTKLAVNEIGEERNLLQCPETKEEYRLIDDSTEGSCTPCLKRIDSGASTVPKSG